MKIDLHCHSRASWDSVSDFGSIIRRCKATGIRVQAITDHNEIWGAQALQKMTQDDPELGIIVGEEVYTKDGEIIGLYLQERIPPGLSTLETVNHIKAQQGLVLLPHPFDKLKRSHLKSSTRESLIDYIDIVEVFNAHISRQHYNREAQEWAQKHHKMVSAGSDGHTIEHIGSAYTEVPEGDLSTPQALMQSLVWGHVVGRWRHPASTLISRVLHYSHQKLSGVKSEKE